MSSDTWKHLWSSRDQSTERTVAGGTDTPLGGTHSGVGMSESQARPCTSPALSSQAFLPLLASAGTNLAAAKATEKCQPLPPAALPDHEARILPPPSGRPEALTWNSHRSRATGTAGACRYRLLRRPLCRKDSCWSSGELRGREPG